MKKKKKRLTLIHIQQSVYNKVNNDEKTIDKNARQKKKTLLKLHAAATKDEQPCAMSQSLYGNRFFPIRQLTHIKDFIYKQFICIHTYIDVNIYVHTLSIECTKFIRIFKFCLKLFKKNFFILNLFLSLFKIYIHK